MIRAPKAPDNYDDAEAWEKYDHAWFIYNLKWYTFCVVGTFVISLQLWLLYMLVSK